MDNMVIDIATSVQLDGIYSGLEDNPNDWDLWGILGDLYYEIGDTLAEDCIRWQVKNHKRPLGTTRDDGAIATGAIVTWFNRAVYKLVAGQSDIESDLPEELFLALKGHHRSSQGVWSSYQSLRCAEEGLIQAWKDIMAKTSVIVWTSNSATTVD